MLKSLSIRREEAIIIPRLPGLKLWLDASDAGTITSAYRNLTSTVTGTSGLSDLVCSGDESLTVFAGTLLRVAGTDVYTASSVATSIGVTTITVVGTLSTNYVASVLATLGVSQWNDKSGNGNHVTQGTSTAQPTTSSTKINNRNVLSFDGGSDYFLNNNFVSFSQNPHTVFFIAKPGNNAGNKTVMTWQKFGDGANTDRIIFWFNATEQTVYHDGTTANIVDTTSFTSTAVLVSNTHSSTTVTTRINGAAANSIPTITDALPTGVETFSIGQEPDGASPGTPSDFHLGDIAEILGYSRVLSASEIAKVEKYLAQKWGVTLA